MDIDPAMRKAQKLFEKSNQSLERLGEEMGYSGDTRRKSAWQFLNMTADPQNMTADPQLSMLRKFCKAMGISIKDLL